MKANASAWQRSGSIDALARRLGDGVLPAALLGLAACASVALLLALTSHLSFFFDDWEVLLHRRGLGLDVIMDPNNQHPAMVPILVYKALLATFGMDSNRPFMIAALVTFIASVALLYVWLSRRVGPWPALAGCAVILFLGPAFEDLLWQFQIGYFGSMACGLGMLLALDRDDRTGDRVGCALLAVSLTFSSVGLAFIPGAAVSIGWDRRRWRRAYVVAIPVALYVLWWLGWGDKAQSALTWHALATSPTFVLDGLSAGIADLLGLASPRSDTALDGLAWGRPLLIAGLGLAGWRLIRLGRIPKGLVVVVVIAVSFWVLVAANPGLGREAVTSRYQYVGAILVLLVAGELLRGVSIGPLAVCAALAVAAVATASNLNFLSDSQNDLQSVAQRERGALAALEITRERVDPGFLLTNDNSDVFWADLVDAGSYLSAVDAFGSPAYPPAELAGAPEEARVAADKVLAGALGVGLEPGRRPPPGARCESVGSEPTSASVVDLPPGGVAVEAPVAGGAQLGLRRYATESFPVQLGTLAAGDEAAVAIPPDLSDRGWQLAVAAPGEVRICTLASS